MSNTKENQKLIGISAQLISKNKSVESTELELEITPVYPNEPVKIYHNALECKKEIYQEFKQQTIIYM